MKIFGTRIMGILGLSMLLLAFYGCGGKQEPSSARSVSNVEAPKELPVLLQNELYKNSAPPQVEEESPSLAAYLESQTPKESEKKSTAPVGD